VLWVHATLLESVPLIYERLVAPLTPAERDAYCDEAAVIATELGARTEEVPHTWAATRRYLGRDRRRRRGARARRGRPEAAVFGTDRADRAAQPAADDRAAAAWDSRSVWIRVERTR